MNRNEAATAHSMVSALDPSIVTWVNHESELFLQDVCSQPELNSFKKELND